MTGPLLTLLAVALYGVVHSLLASNAAKRLTRRLIGPAGSRTYRLAYNLFAVVSLIPVLAVPALNPGSVLYRLPLPWSAAFLAGQAVALGVLAVGLLQTDAWHFLGFRQLAESEPGTPARLVVGGLYRWVRHPLYTAGLALIWLSPWMTTSLLAFNLASTVYVVIGSSLEERRLLAEFGTSYAEYQRTVPRLIPHPFRRPAPALRQA